MEVKKIIRKILDNKNVPKKDCSDMDNLIKNAETYLGHISLRRYVIMRLKEFLMNTTIDDNPISLYETTDEDISHCKDFIKKFETDYGKVDFLPDSDDTDTVVKKYVLYNAMLSPDDCDQNAPIEMGVGLVFNANCQMGDELPVCSASTALNAMMTREIFVEDQELARRFIAYTMEN